MTFEKFILTLNEEWHNTHNSYDYAKAAYEAGQKAERETCAKEAMLFGMKHDCTWKHSQAIAAKCIAEAIRQRGEK